MRIFSGIGISIPYWVGILLHLTAILLEVVHSFPYLSPQVILMYPVALNRTTKKKKEKKILPLYPCGGSYYCPEMFIPILPSPSQAQYPYLLLTLGLVLGFASINIMLADMMWSKAWTALVWLGLSSCFTHLCEVCFLRVTTASSAWNEHVWSRTSPASPVKTICPRDPSLN